MADEYLVGRPKSAIAYLSAETSAYELADRQGLALPKTVRFRSAGSVSLEPARSHTPLMITLRFGEWPESTDLVSLIARWRGHAPLGEIGQKLPFAHLCNP